MQKNKKVALFSILASSMLVMAACGSKSDSKKDSSKTEVSGNLQAAGSTALQPLAAAAAEEFMGKYPSVSIQVNGGGSGTGLSQASEGSIQVGNSDVFAEEKGIKGLVDHKVAVVGITAAINPEANVKDISKEDLIKVFTGKITNWKELGGEDVKITLVNRPDSSGTRAVFNKFALDGATPAEGITEDASNTVKKIIGETPGAIGYLAFSYLKDDTVVAMSIDGVKPTDENVETGKFPVWAYEHMYTKGEATGVTKKYIDYVLSDDVQKNIVPEQGYIPMTEMKIERDAEGIQKDL